MGQLVLGAAALMKPARDKGDHIQHLGYSDDPAHSNGNYDH